MPFQDQFWSIAEFFDPQLSTKLENEWKDKPNEYLLKKWGTNNYLYRGIASEILIEKRDSSLVPIFIGILKSGNVKHTGTAIRALGKIGDERAIPYLMEFVKKGTENVHYRTALLALSEMHEISIIPEIIKLARTKIEKDIRPQQYAIEMMSNYDNPELTKLLKEFTRDKSDFVRYDAEKALKKIEERRKSKALELIPRK